MLRGNRLIYKGRKETSSLICSNFQEKLVEDTDFERHEGSSAKEDKHGFVPIESEVES